MCFSAESSFGAAAVLAAGGVFLVKKFYKGKMLPLALIPIFFAIQQFSEGLLWVALTHGTYPNAYSLAAQYIFLFFAYMFWPVWIPFSFALVAGKFWRKYTLIGLALAGSCFFFYFAYDFIVFGNVKARIMGHSINYGETNIFYRILYAIIALTPFFLSRIPKMWILGVINILSFIAADISYNYAFTSVWCFEAAIVTIGLILLLEVEYPKKNKT